MSKYKVGITGKFKIIFDFQWNDIKWCDNDGFGKIYLSAILLNSLPDINACGTQIGNCGPTLLSKLA